MATDYAKWDSLVDPDEEFEKKVQKHLAERRERLEQGFQWDSVEDALRNSTPITRDDELLVTLVRPKGRAIAPSAPPVDAHRIDAAGYGTARAGSWQDPPQPVAGWHSFTSGLLGVVWFVEALNYGVHVVFRPEPWNLTSTIAGYTVWAVQLACLVQCQLTDPSRLPPEWEEQARAGAVPATTCKRTGRLLPPRARYVRRTGTVVIGLDHYCFWLGKPIGLFNRKFFVLFVAYSALFCAMGSAHSWYELLVLAPARLGAAPPPPLQLGRSVRAPVSAARACWSWLQALHGRASDAGHGGYLLALLATTLINPAGAVLLGMMALTQLLLVAYNRTSLEPDDDRYDVGVAANWRQVFGRSCWALPVRPQRGAAQPEADGLSWPTNPKGSQTSRERAAPEVGATRQRWGWLWVPFWAVLQWEHWFCCGAMGVGCVRHTLRLILLVRSNHGRPFVPRAPNEHTPTNPASSKRAA